jgi:hypothetical protein
MKNTTEKLNDLNACEEAVTWAGNKPIQEIWGHLP